MLAKITDLEFKKIEEGDIKAFGEVIEQLTETFDTKNSMHTQGYNDCLEDVVNVHCKEISHQFVEGENNIVYLYEFLIEYFTKLKKE